MTDESNWQAFGVRSRRATGAQTRPTFGGFDWQGSDESGSPDGREPGRQASRDAGERVFGDSGRQAPRDTGATASRVFDDANRGREFGVPDAQPFRTPPAAGRPPIRTTNDTDSGATPTGGEASDPQGTRGTRRSGSPNPNPETAFPGSVPPPPPASARFPDTPPPESGSASGTESRSTDRTPPASGPAPSAPGVVPPRPPSDPSVPPRRTGAPAETASETTFRIRPVPAGPTSGGAAVPPVPKTRPGAGSGRPEGAATGPQAGARPGAPARPGFPPRPTREASASSTTRTPPAPAEPPRTPPSGASLSPDPALSWSAPMPPHAGTPGNGRPVVSFGEPEVGYGQRLRTRGMRLPARIVSVTACVVLGLGLIGGAVTGSWLIGDSGEDGGRDSFTVAGELWHSVPVDQLFPPTVDGQGAGPGGADRTWTRIAVAPDSGCTDAFDPLLRKVLAPVGCERLLRATYTDATQSYVTTVGLLFTDADATAMRELDTRFTKEGLDARTDLMPLPYAAKNTLAADFGARQRASWTVSVLTDAPVVAYAVSGWADGRTVDAPEPAEKAMESGDTSPAAQSGLGNEAQGLADRVERALRKTVTSPPEQPS
ncbi:hypothetical protein [Streptomyces sp. NPDC005374]|uniref:hypothetical protein n=1 Tax=Streptomyces sp. NPDC005374 TaxID=3364713 RepID=UPI003697D496